MCSGVATGRRELATWGTFTILLLYPGFFFYHANVGSSEVEVVPWGYLTSVGVILAASGVVAAVLAPAKRRYTLTSIDVMFGTLCAIMLCWTLAMRLFGAPYQREGLLLWQNCSTIVLWTLNFVAFRQVAPDRPRDRLMMLAAACGIVILTGTHLQDGLFRPISEPSPATSAPVAVYQGYARSAFLVFLLLCAVTRSAAFLAVAAVGATCLFLIGARSEFLGFIMACGGMWLWSQDMRFRVGHLVLVLAIVGGSVFGEGLLRGGNVRMAQLLELGADESFLARGAMARDALEVLKSAPVIGDYGVYLTQHGPGGYAHNALSVWTEFGALAFLLFCSLVGATGAVVVASRRESRGPSVRNQLAVGLFIHMVVMAITAKAYMYPLLAASWGAASGLAAERRRFFCGAQ